MTTTVRRIGSLTVPSVCLGAMNFGTTVGEKTAVECLDIAADVGLTFWDTANNYAFWNGGTGDESETVLGRWFSARGSSARDETILATKVGARPRPGFRDLAHVLGLSPAAIRDQVTGCLRRLRTDRIDLLYAHLDDLSVGVEETLGALGDLVEEGLVREIGASNFTVPRWREAVAAPVRHPYRALQQRFTLLPPADDADFAPQVAVDARTQDAWAAPGVTLLGYSPLLHGSYADDARPVPRNYAGPRVAEAVGDVRRLATEVGLDAGALVLAWSAQRSRPVIPLAGISRPERVATALAAREATLTGEQLDLLEAIHHGG